MRQFLLPRDWDGGSPLRISGKESRRLVSVLRLRVGDSFPAMAEGGLRFSCVAIAVERDGMTVEVLPAAPAGDAPLPDVRAGSRDKPPTGAAAAGETPNTIATRLTPIVLAVGTLKGAKLDEVARAAAEAGVSCLVPLQTERSVPRGDFSPRLARLRRIVDEALSQSGSKVPTRVSEPMSLAELDAAWPRRDGRLRAAFHETPLAEMTIHRYCESEPDEIVACVGPEGGFSDSELEFLADRGFGFAWLGPNVLRAETAAVFALASLRIVCLERPSWSMKK